MDLFAKLIGNISGFMYDRLLIIMLLAVGLFFTIATRFPQFRMLAESIRVVGEKPGTKGGVSSFQALMVSTASRVGTGNIVGVSVAICSGGYGAVFWMWVIAIIGGASAFVESTLAQIYKRRDAEGGKLWRTGLLHRGADKRKSPVHYFCSLHDSHLCRWLQHAGLVQSAVYLQRLQLL